MPGGISVNLARLVLDLNVALASGETARFLFAKKYQKMFGRSVSLPANISEPAVFLRADKGTKMTLSVDLFTSDKL